MLVISSLYRNPYTLPETNIAPENGWLEYHRFLYVSGSVNQSEYLECNPRAFKFEPSAQLNKNIATSKVGS